MKNIYTQNYTAIYKDINHLGLPEDEQALFAVMIFFACQRRTKETNWGWLAVRNLFISARKNVTSRAIFGSLDGTKPTKHDCDHYKNVILDWLAKDWIQVATKEFDGSLKGSAAWYPRKKSPKIGDQAPVYRINFDVIEKWSETPKVALF